MAYNDPQHPEIARESQDVETPPLRVEEAPHHTGRGMFFFSKPSTKGPGIVTMLIYMCVCVCFTIGGAANAYVPSADEEKLVRQAEEEQLRRVYTRRENEQAGESEEKK